MLEAAEFSECNDCFPLRAKTGFPATLAWDQFFISCAVSTSSNVLKACSTVILLRSTRSAW